MATAPLNDPQTGRGTQAAAGRELSDVGEVLRHARERRGLTVEQLSRETKLPQRHLLALERGDLEALPGSFYQRAEIRTYARAVGLDPDFALTRLEGPQPALSARRDAAGTARGGTASASAGRRLPIALGAAGALLVGVTVMAPRPPLFDPPAVEAPPPAPPAPAGTGNTQVGTSGVGADTADAATAAKGAPATPPSIPAAAPSPPADAAAATAAAAPTVPSPRELVVTSDPPGARVTVNGIGWGVTPVTIRYLTSGDKRIRVSLAGYETAERLVRLGDQPLTTGITLQRAP